MAVTEGPTRARLRIGRTWGPAPVRDPGVPDPDAPDSTRSIWIDRVGALSLGLLALGLSLYQIDRWAFWHDEAFTMGAISGTWDDLLRFAHTREINMFTYYALLKGWTAFGTSDAWIRALSAILGAISVVCLFGLARTLFSRNVAWLAAAILAVNAFLLQYGQEARTYTLSVLLAIVSTWALVRALRAPSRIRWAGYIALAALIPYTHVILLAMYPVHAIAALSAEPRPSWRWLLVVGVAVLLLIEPALQLAVVQEAAVLAWVPSPSVSGVVHSVRRLDGMGGPGPLATIPVLGSPRALPIVSGALAALGAASLVATGRRGRMPLLLVISWATVPIAAAVAVSLAKPVFVTRYLIFVIPAFAMLIALGVVALRQQRMRAAAAALVLVLAANGAIGWYGSSPRPDWRAAAAWVVARSTSNDRAVYVGYFGRELPYYAEQDGEGDRVPVTLYHGLDYRSPTYPQDLANVAKGVVAHDRVLWVVLTAAPLPPPARDPRLVPLQQVMHLQEVQRFNRVVVALFVPPVEEPGSVRA
jgi:mannosyltransferase